jgi:4-amino-4-deoxy-L-arabinose transferase-like glycosyltransferase
MYGRPWPGPVAPRRTTLATAAALVTLIALGGFVRLLGIDFGRPFAYHPDEGIIVGSAMDMVRDRDWNPHNFFYSSLMFDVQAVATGIVRSFGGGSLEHDQGWLFGSEALPRQFDYFLAGRSVVALMGIVTIPVTFAIGARSGGIGVGLIAAAIAAAAPLHVANSHYITTDVPLTLLCALTLWAALEAQRRRGDRWWVLAGLVAGLAISTKWNGAVVIVVPLVAYLATADTFRGAGALLRRRTPYLILAAAALALLVTTPAILFDAAAVRDFLVLQGELYARGRANERSDSLTFHVRALLDGIGFVASVLGLSGCVAIVVGRHRRELAIPAFVVAYLLVISIPATHYERNLLPIVPYLSIAAGLLLVRAIERWTRGRPTFGGISTTLLTIGLVMIAVFAALAPGYAASYAEGRRMGSPDTRTVARDWLLANVPRKSIVAREQYTPQLTPDEYRLRNHDFLWQRNWAWYREQGVRYLITSSLVYARFYENPDAPTQDTFYTELFGLPEVFRVDPDPDTPGPTIRIFELSGGAQAPI